MDPRCCERDILESPASRVERAKEEGKTKKGAEG